MQASDNTRHLNVNRKTGEPFLLPADAIRRVVLCTGQIYYALSNARRAKRIRDIVFVRLEQIAPFPHDILVRVRIMQLLCSSLINYKSCAMHSVARQALLSQTILLLQLHQFCKSPSLYRSRS